MPVATPSTVLRRRKVTFVLPSLEAGGAQRVLLNLARHVDRERFNLSIILFDATGPLAPQLPDNGPIVVLGYRRLRYALPRLALAIRRLNPDVIVSTFGHVNLAIVLFRKILGINSKIVIREPNTPSASMPSLKHTWFLRLGYKWLYSRADYVICQSQVIAEELMHDFGVRQNQVAYLKNPVDVNAIRAGIFHLYRPTPEGCFFVAMGSLTHQKGFDRLLAWFSHLPREASLWILGSGEEMPTLIELARELGVSRQVTFKGHVQNPWPILASADAFLLPSRWEGMPNAALEALASGTPVISTCEAGGIGEVAETAPAGAVRLAATEDDFIDAMKAVLPMPRDSIARESLLPAGFSLDAVMAEFNELLAGATDG